MLKNKIPDVIGLVTNTVFNAKIGEVKKFLIILTILLLLNLINFLVKYLMQNLKKQN